MKPVCSLAGGVSPEEASSIRDIGGVNQRVSVQRRDVLLLALVQRQCE